MKILCDTNIMWRRIDVSDPNHQLIRSSVDALVSHGAILYVTAQNLIEFQSLATRPISSNGLGYTPQEANHYAAQILRAFSFLDETPEIYKHWRWLMEKYEVRGRPVHDAHLVAVMLTYGITHILTRNGADFRRYREIIVVEV